MLSVSITEGCQSHHNSYSRLIASRADNFSQSGQQSAQTRAADSSLVSQSQQLYPISPITAHIICSIDPLGQSYEQPIIVIVDGIASQSDWLLQFVLANQDCQSREGYQ